MGMLICGFLFSAGTLAARQVRGGSPQTAKASNVSASEKAKIDVCTLLTSGEIEGVQGEPVMETKASTQPSGATLLSLTVFHSAALLQTGRLRWAHRYGAGP